MERRAVDDGGHGGVDAESEIWLRQLKRRPKRAPLGGHPYHSLGQGEEEKRGGSRHPSAPIFPPRRLAREVATLWPATGGEATEGSGGRGQGGEHKLLHDCRWGETAPPYQVDWSRVLLAYLMVERVFCITDLRWSFSSPTYISGIHDSVRLRQGRDELEVSS
ncbi:hypothetical protein Sjap_003551 [Stephania japonica]|uniref:Uncharacterized protein n=1 Tax=Stephania japonica TaxID=461633 RepID=A0AAP0PX94_9MAGN